MIDFDKIETVRLERYLHGLDTVTDDWQPCEDCGQPGTSFQVTEENSNVVGVILCPDCADKELVDCEHSDGTDHWVWKEDCLPWTEQWKRVDDCEWFCRDEYMRQLDSRITIGKRLDRGNV